MRSLRASGEIGTHAGSPTGTVIVHFRRSPEFGYLSVRCGLFSAGDSQEPRSIPFARLEQRA